MKNRFVIIDGLNAAIFAMALVIAQIVFFQQLTYFCGSHLNFILSLGIFLSISLGSTLGMMPFAATIHVNWLPILSCALYSGALLGTMAAPNLGLLWVLISFLGYGLQMSRFYSVIQLKVLVVSIGFGGVLSYLLLNPLYSALGSQIVVFSCVLPIVGCWVTTKTVRNAKICSVVLGTVLVAMPWSSISNSSRSFAERTSPGFKQSSRKIKTDFTPLLLTDLIWSERLNRYYILTNGVRFSAVTPLRSFKQPLTNVPSFDLPYLLKKPRKVLIVGPGGGANVLTALKHEVPEIYAVEINPMVYTIMTGPLAEHTNGLYSIPSLKFITREGRNFLETTKEQFDLIVLQGVQTGSKTSALNTAVLESFLFTKEALDRMWKLLTPNGMIFIEEYQYFIDAKNERLTLIDNLAFLAESVTGLKDFEKHVLISSYAQAAKNPMSTIKKRSAHREI